MTSGDPPDDNADVGQGAGSAPDPVSFTPMEIELSSGSKIPGDLIPLGAVEVPDALSNVLNPIEVLPPERPGEVPDDPAATYTSQSASGFEFPREHLRSDFDKRLRDRHRDGLVILPITLLGSVVVDADRADGGATNLWKRLKLRVRRARRGTIGSA